MNGKKRHPQGIYERTIERDGRRVIVYDAVYEAPRQDGRRRKAWKRGFPTQREAIAWRDDRRVRVRSGDHVPPSRLTVAAYLDAWLPAIRASVRPSTWSSYAMHCRVHVTPRIGGRALQQLSVEDVNRLYAELLENGLSPASVQRVAATIHRALRDARRSGRVTRNVADDAERPKVEAPELKVWSPEQVRKFLAFAAERDEQWHALFALMVATGLRRGEAVGLRWAAIDLDAATLRVVRALVSVEGSIVESEPKTRRSRRTVGLDPETVSILRRQRARQAERRLAWGEAWRENELVFDAGDGTPLHPDRVSKAFSKMVVKAGVPVIRLHDLRHTAATLMLRAGVPAKVASERLGHSNIGITLDTYTAFIPALDEDAALRTAGLIYGSG